MLSSFLFVLQGFRGRDELLLFDDVDRASLLSVDTLLDEYSSSAFEESSVLSL